MIITEPKWKSYIVETTTPVFTPEQCQKIIEAGRKQPRQDALVGGDRIVNTNTRISHISWIPFDSLQPMYKKIEELMLRTNGNHFGFDGMRLTEPAQYTEYTEGGFYDWHMDNDASFDKEPPVRKISMTLALSPDNEFEGGGLEFMENGQIVKPKQGHAIFFASFNRHKAMTVTKGNRKSLVMWFGGPPFK